MRVHTGERPYSCKVQKKKFQTFWNPSSCRSAPARSPTQRLWNCICECTQGRSLMCANCARSLLHSCHIWRSTCSVSTTPTSPTTAKSARGSTRSVMSHIYGGKWDITWVWLEQCFKHRNPGEDRLWGARSKGAPGRPSRGSHSWTRRKDWGRPQLHAGDKFLVVTVFTKPFLICQA